MKLTLSLLFSAILIATGYLRFSGVSETALSSFAGLATPIYIGATIIFAILLQRAGAEFNRLGFGKKFRRWHLGAALIAVAFLQAYAAYGYPFVESLFGENSTGVQRRFSDVEGSLSNLAMLLAFSWIFAAIGEEVAFRIVLLRGLASGLGDGAIVLIAALLIQAAIFGAVHLYKGPPGMISSALSGLIFGCLVLAARGAIWPAVLAHGLNNTIGIVQIYSGE